MSGSVQAPVLDHKLHGPGWHAKLLPDGTLDITDPQGQVRTSHPPRAGPRLW